MVNTDLLQRTLAHIETHPEQWDQGNWASQTDGDCGTAYCFAGWAVMLAHPAALPLFKASPLHWRTDRTAQYAQLEPGGREAVSIADAARDLLGLDQETADVLFDGGNSLDDLARYVANLVEGWPISLDADA